MRINNLWLSFDLSLVACVFGQTDGSYRMAVLSIQIYM